MQAGFACLESGLTRSKNSINVAVKNITDFGVAALLFWAFGFALMFGLTHNGLFGRSDFLLEPGGDTWKWAFFVFQCMFCATSATIVSGAVAERMTYGSYIFVTTVISGLVYPIFGHWAWGSGFYSQSSGWLQRLGFVDFAGSTVVHSIGGWIGLAAILVIGPRSGRFTADGKAVRIPGHDTPVAILGTLLLWFGWFGFNGGSTLAMDKNVPRIIATTLMAGAAGLMGAMALGWWREGLPQVSFAINGSLAGLVAITANCHAVSAAQAVIIGAVGGMLAVLSETLLERLRIDDAVGAIPVHLVAGVWGTLAVGLFGNSALLGTGLSRWQQVGVQALGIATAGAFAFLVGLVVFWIFNRIHRMRVTPEEEHTGLNVSEHGATTEIIDLFAHMERQRSTADLSLRLPVEPFTEVGQIAERFNQILDALSQIQREKEELLNNDLLLSVSDGIFLLKPDLRIGLQYSRALESLLGRGDLAGTNFASVLQESMTHRTREALSNFLELMFEGKRGMRSIQKLNPLERFEMRQEDGTERILQFRFTRLLSEGVVSSLLVTVTDVTDSVRLLQEVEESEKKTRHVVERTMEILHLEPSMLADFVADTRLQLQNMSALLQEDRTPLPEKLTKLLVLAHSLKGNAGLLGVHRIATETHSMEEKLNQLRQTPEVSGADFVEVALSLRTLFTELHEIESFTARLADFHARFQEAMTAEQILASVQKAALDMAGTRGKKVAIQSRDFEVSLIPASQLRFLRDILVQLVRNAVVHGIEEPEVRLGAGKPENGTITISTARSDGAIEVIVRDDGRGIETEHIRSRALAAGRWPKDDVESWDEARLARLIFESGFSTQAEVDQAAGRGVGMSVVLKTIRQLGGKLISSYGRGRYCQFRIVLPERSAYG